MTVQDQRVEALLALIEEKKAKIAEKDISAKFITKKILSYEGLTYNFNTMSKSDIVILIGKLNAVVKGIKMYDEDLFEHAVIEGHAIQDWLTDLTTMLNTIVVRDEKKLLKTLESKLDGFFSEQKKQELELNEIEKFLKGEVK